MTFDNVITRLKRHINKHYKSQAEFARHLDMDRSQLNRMIGGKEAPTKPVLDEIGVIKTIGYRLKK